MDLTQPDDNATIIFTSGTTGTPKGVMLTSRNIVNDGYYIGENMNYTEKDRLLLQVPLFHCFGTVLGVMAVITHGSTMVVLEEYVEYSFAYSYYLFHCSIISFNCSGLSANAKYLSVSPRRKFFDLYSSNSAAMLSQKPLTL